MKRHLLSGILALTAIVALFSCKKKEEHSSSPRDIDVAEAFTDSIVLHKSYPGYLGSDNSADVVCLVDGQVLTQNFQGGSYVKKGQVLFTIDPTLYRNAVEQAEATLASAISNRDYAKSHYEAVKKALQADAVSKMEVLNAESAYHQAEASIKNAQAALATARTQLGYCSVRSPFNGFISDCYVGAGNYVSGSASPVTMARVYENEVFTVVFQIEDLQYEKMVGAGSSLTSDLYKAIPLQFRDTLMNRYTANLAYQSPAVDKSTGTVELKGKVHNRDNELKDGMYVTISLPYGIDPHAILVKDAAISTDQLGKYLYVVNDSNKVVYTPVEIGELYQDSLRIINKGIRPGEKYVTKAILSVRNGETVNPVLRN